MSEMKYSFPTDFDYIHKDTLLEYGDELQFQMRIMQKSRLKNRDFCRFIILWIIIYHN